jgi:hypothetical protein
VISALRGRCPEPLDECAIRSDGVYNSATIPVLSIGKKAYLRRIHVVNQGEVEKARMGTPRFPFWPLFDGQNWLFV